jgi:hypothetical protein
MGVLRRPGRHDAPRPNPVKPNPEKSVRGEEPNPTWALPPQDTHLMSQRDELEFQGGAATKPEAEYGNDGGKNRDHARDGRAVAQKSPAFLGPSEFCASTAVAQKSPAFLGPSEF